LAGLSLRDLARTLGMATPSLYSYFDSKHALYDAMYADGWRDFIAFDPITEQASGLREAIRVGIDRWVRFSLDDPVRFQLLSLRTIPGFEPSAASYAVAQQAYDESFAPLDGVAAITQEHKDLITAMASGLLNQQFANDPGGTRWVRLMEDAVDLLTRWVSETLPNQKAAPKPKPRSRKAKP
jgi:AcrR family transcriptional regulator